MVPVVSLIGHHNSGKTTLGSAVAALLKADGYKVGVIKSTKEKGIQFDHPGTDTDTYTRAGAEGVVLSAPDQLMFLSRQAKRDPLRISDLFFHDTDIVLIEGFKHTPSLPKIEVHRDNSAYLFRQVEGVIALVTNGPPVSGLECFTPAQHLDIATFITRTFLAVVPDSPPKLRLLVDGREVNIPNSLRKSIRSALDL